MDKFKLRILRKHSLPLMIFSIITSMPSFADSNDFEFEETAKSKNTRYTRYGKEKKGMADELLAPLKPVVKESPTAKEILGHIDVLKELKEKAKEEYMDLDAIGDKVFKTQSGQHLKAYFPGKSVSEALEGMIHKELKTIQGKIQGQKKRDSTFTEGDPILDMLTNNYDRVYLESLAYAKRSLANEVKYGKEYYALYHAHMPDLSLYYDMLKEIKQIIKIQSFGGTNIFREMNDTYPSIKNLLKSYEDNLKEVSKANNKPLNATGPGSTMGFSEAPDHIIWAKNYMVSANISLFGNLGKLGENTFYYFLNSMSHISNVDFLMQRLLKTILPDFSDDEVAQRLSKYKNLFEKHKRKGGGHLLQVFVKKDKIDQMAFASHPYGVPIWLDKKTKHFAMAKGKRTPLAQISADEKKYRLPKVSSYIDLYTFNPKKFSDVYSPVHKKGNAKQEYAYNDTAQVRLVMDPQQLLENTFVIESTRNKIFKTDEMDYEDGLKGDVLEDMSHYISYTQSHASKTKQSSSKPANQTPLDKMIHYMNQEQAIP